jgi:hypothetical protein
MLGNRASLPAALIRDERQCHAKAAPTERPFRQGRATTSAGMAMAWRGDASPACSQEWSRAGFSRTQLLERSPFCRRAHGGAARIRKLGLVLLQAATRWFLLRGVLAQNIWCLRRANLARPDLARWIGSGSSAAHRTGCDPCVGIAVKQAQNAPQMRQRGHAPFAVLSPSGDRAGQSL